MREKLYLYIVKPHGEGLWDITHLSSEELISNFSDERITVRLLYDEDLFNYLMENPRMLIVSKKPLSNVEHKSWNIYEASFYEFNSDVYPHGPYEIMTGEKKIATNIGANTITPEGLSGTGWYVFKPARKHIWSHACNYHWTIIGFSNPGRPLNAVLLWSPIPSGDSPSSIVLSFVDDPYRVRIWPDYGAGNYVDIPIPDTSQIRSIALQLDVIPIFPINVIIMD